MADGPRCQRRKQAMPRRNNVRSFSNVSEAASDSDDEDKLHIVEEDSISDTPDEKPTVLQLSAAQKLHNGHTQDDGNLGPDALVQEIRVKEECITDEEDEEGQANETPQEKEQSTPEGRGHDENGTPDDFSKLHTCPYCSRGYKRHTSLKEHIKLRHEKSGDDFSCSLCSYTFSYRTQLDRHITAHKNGREQQAVSQSGANRKFKCTECSKAFKYKHHLKEHLRIHSGEKPYECSNCKKRFSHSGSYSSHISNKKCVATPPNSTSNGLSRIPGVKAALTSTQPTRILLREKVDIDNKPLQEQLPPKQIKEEPVEHDLKSVKSPPAVTTTTSTTGSTTTSTDNGGGVPIQAAAPQGMVQTLVVPTVGLVQPFSINISDLQNVLKAAMEGSMIRQVVANTNASGTGAKVVNQVQPGGQAMVLQSSQPHGQVISAISLPVLNQDGNAKFIIKYNVNPKSNTPNAESGTTEPQTQTQAVDPAAVQVNPPPPKAVQVSATQLPKALQINTEQPNITPTQTPSTPIPVNIQTNANKPPSIIKVTKLVPSQAKPTFLLLRNADGTQSLVVRQLPTVNPTSQAAQAVPRTAEPNPTPDEPTAVAERSSPAEPNHPAQESATAPENGHRPEDLSSDLLQEIEIKTEPMSPPEMGCEVQTEIVDNLGIKREKEEARTVHTSIACGDGFHNYATCLFCDNSPSNLDILNCLHSDEQGCVSSLSSLLKEEDPGSVQSLSLKSLLPLLKAYSKDSHPTEEQLCRIAESVGLPSDVVGRWFEKMRSKKISLRLAGNGKNGQPIISNSQPDPRIDTQTSDTPTESQDEASEHSNPSSPLNLTTNDLVIVKTEEPEEDAQAEPLDLSLPKTCDSNASVATTPAAVSAQEEPLNLTCFKKDMLQGNTIYVAQSATGPINIIATPLPTLVAIAESGGVPCLRAAISTKHRTILIPQLSYTYVTPSINKVNTATSVNSIATLTPTETQGTAVLNGCQEKADAGAESVSEWEGLNNSNLSPNRKRRRMQSGQYACDLCDKIFQKSSSLLRHKYEHTGKRPYECGVCKKAFKHKHHLIEHSRLHSGEKPYQCDKCGKRFSHSGSYSQHMNHRYSYCKKEGQDQPEPNSATFTPPLQLDSDERESEDEEGDEQAGERDGEDDAEFADLDMSEIRVVRIGEEYDDDDDDEEEEEPSTMDDEGTDIQVVKVHTVDEETMETTETEDSVEAQEETRTLMENVFSL
ncbi:zinc finger E-box-binding homeobox 1 isoform X2 [Trichomycterus rosablanca]|uniref:zinc finger E-box-binding homeobox 1 isoform X2 n=1 Tax=Trichomycterus rosablanca TaxID=2290929 RepID=UPI002F355297